MSFNYPPGVTGNEYEIAGPDWEVEVTGECPSCGHDDSLLAQGYGGGRWTVCLDCDWYSDTDYLTLD